MEASDEHFHMILATFSGEDYLMNPNDGSKMIQPHWHPNVVKCGDIETNFIATNGHLIQYPNYKSNSRDFVRVLGNGDSTSRLGHQLHLLIMKLVFTPKSSKLCY